ncbi:MAG: AI-2E family transporter, partial [Kiloniellales bacterium]|nr:AI-2E family transporter [Kiloniellales bacterium]
MSEDPETAAQAEPQKRPTAWRAPSLALSVLAILAVLYTLYFAADFLIPVVAAAVLNLVLSPIPRFFARFRIPDAVTASIIVPSFFVLVFLAVYALAEPTREWMGRLPEISRDIQTKLRDIKEPVSEVQEASKEVEKVASVDDEGAPEPEVRVKPPSLLERLFGTLQEVGIQTGVTFVLLYFLLASGEMFKEKLVR